MPSHTSIKSTSSAIPKRAPIQKTCTAHQYVGRYTEMLVTGTNQFHALQRLLQIDCPIRVFEDCSTEVVLKKFSSQLSQYTYQTDKLAQKFSDLRRREMRHANQRFEKSGELTAHVSFTSEFVDFQKKIMEQKSHRETNQLFASAVAATQENKENVVSQVRRVKVDYSKYKITKRSHSTSSSCSSKSSSVSP